MCHLAPPDAYENDNSPVGASAYSGYQIGHTFHDSGDVDWVKVWFGVATKATFETYNISANTGIEVYEFNLNTGLPGALIGSNDDACYPYHGPFECFRSKVVLNVPAGSAYFVKISNKWSSDFNVYNQTRPTYSFKIY